jgi:hypothetical protein
MLPDPAAAAAANSSEKRYYYPPIHPSENVHCYKANER